MSCSKLWAHGRLAGGVLATFPEADAEVRLDERWRWVDGVTKRTRYRDAAGELPGAVPG